MGKFARRGSKGRWCLAKQLPPGATAGGTGRHGPVDESAGTVRLECTRTKNAEGRTFPFGTMPALKAVLDAQRAYTDQVQRRTGQIFPWVEPYSQGKGAQHRC